MMNSLGLLLLLVSHPLLAAQRESESKLDQHLRRCGVTIVAPYEPDEFHPGKFELKYADGADLPLDQLEDAAMGEELLGAYGVASRNHTSYLGTHLLPGRKPSEASLLFNVPEKWEKEMTRQEVLQLALLNSDELNLSNRQSAIIEKIRVEPRTSGNEFRFQYLRQLKTLEKRSIGREAGAVVREYRSGVEFRKVFQAVQKNAEMRAILSYAYTSRVDSMLASLRRQNIPDLEIRQLPQKRGALPVYEIWSGAERLLEINQAHVILRLDPFCLLYEF